MKEDDKGKGNKDKDKEKDKEKEKEKEEKKEEKKEVSIINPHHMISSN